MLPDGEHLVRYVIPEETQGALKAHLLALRITKRTLFPDLDSLVDTIDYEYQTFIAYTPPKSPRGALGRLSYERGPTPLTQPSRASGAKWR
jgi:hypothetical protein